MPDVFDVALDALYADPNMACDGVYTPDGGAPVAVRVVWAQPDRDFSSSNGGGVTARATIARIRTSELPAAARGAALVVDGVPYQVDKPTQPGKRRREWHLELSPL
ncbi:head-tail joining protein [Nitrospirillum bahiense]|uniref:Head-tail joining protein n=1 Tax=Nitrospirillum amazonense TaxID=28077 RepID=A0A560F1U9_9PROT|nr:hypothetical protein [Nitrospirillum amazonense]TWB15600.1 hypothetical protein FBZ88_12953 [Nitrospirillum amazonense]